MEIKPTYVTFKQAKLLKDKGFNISIKTHYRITGSGIFESNRPANYNDDLTQETAGGMTYVSAPEQWQVVEWLRVKHGIHITYGSDYNWKLKEYRDKAKFYYIINFDLLDSMDKELNPTFLFNTPQEAYSAAIDKILLELTI